MILILLQTNTMSPDFEQTTVKITLHILIQPTIQDLQPYLLIQSWTLKFAKDGFSENLTLNTRAFDLSLFCPSAHGSFLLFPYFDVYIRYNPFLTFMMP